MLVVFHTIPIFFYYIYTVDLWCSDISFDNQIFFERFFAIYFLCLVDVVKNEFG